MQNIPEKYKIYKGRIFLLRNKKFIIVSSDKIAGRGALRRLNVCDTFGEAVFIYDETNAKVEVTTMHGESVWIPKSCLLKEAEDSGIKFENEKTISDFINIVTSSNIAEIKKAALVQLLRKTL